MNSKKNSCRGNYMRKYGSPKMYDWEKIFVLSQIDTINYTYLSAFLGQCATLVTSNDVDVTLFLLTVFI